MPDSDAVLVVRSLPRFAPKNLLALFSSWRSTDVLRILSRISQEAAPGAELSTDGREQSRQLYHVRPALATQPKSETSENVETVKSTKEGYRRQQKPDNQVYHLPDLDDA